MCFWSWCISFAVPMWLDEMDPKVPLGRPLVAAFTHRAALDLLLGCGPQSAPSALSDSPPRAKVRSGRAGSEARSELGARAAAWRARRRSRSWTRPR